MQIGLAESGGIVDFSDLQRNADGCSFVYGSEVCTGGVKNLLAEALASFGGASGSDVNFDGYKGIVAMAVGNRVIVALRGAGAHRGDFEDARLKRRLVNFFDELQNIDLVLEIGGLFDG